VFAELSQEFALTVDRGGTILWADARSERLVEKLRDMAGPRPPVAAATVAGLQRRSSPD
jgi:hypothetical protein